MREKGGRRDEEKNRNGEVRKQERRGVQAGEEMGEEREKESKDCSDTLFLANTPVIIVVLSEHNKGNKPHVYSDDTHLKSSTNIFVLTNLKKNILN